MPTLADQSKPKDLLILIDGHALVHRAFHAFRDPLIVRATGEHVSAVYGFLNTFLRTLKDWNPSHCIVTFDVSAPTFRHEAYSEYKAHRPPTPPELKDQFARVRQFVEAFGVPIFEMAGFEADDLLGTLSKQAEDKNLETLILTGDSDILQLVSPSVRVLLSASVQRTNVYDIEAVKNRYGGLGPEYVAEIKALQGDKSDNIPGVPRIGAKSAIKLLTEYGSIDSIYKHLDTVKPPGTQKTLEENEDMARQGKMLTTISRNVPIRLDLEDCLFGNFERSDVVQIMRELEFFSLVNKIPTTLDITPPKDGEQLELMADKLMSDSIKKQYTTVSTKAQLEDMLHRLEDSEIVSFDTETTSTNSITASLVGISFCNEEGISFYIPVGHQEGKQLETEFVIEKIRPLMENPSIQKAAHNANYDITVLENHDISVRNLAFDTMLAAHFSGRKSIGLKQLSLECLHEEMTPITDLIGTGRNQKTMREVPIEEASPYAAADADMTHRLVPIFKQELESKGLAKPFEKVEIPLIPVLVSMQRNGVAVNTTELSEMSKSIGEQLDRIKFDMYEVVGREFNINSSQQLGDVLFNQMRLPPTRKTQKGYSTDAAALDSLKALMDEGKADNVEPVAYEMLDKVLEFRQLSKIKSTYVDALPNLVNPATRRIHTNYNQTGSSTGRISSSDPNVQNIPVRTELGRKVRDCFIAENAPEWTLLAADYSQIELRVLAHISKDKGLLNAFHNGEDIHAATASSVYGVPIGDVTAEMRRIAKIMNFGVLYGLSAFGIRQQTGLTAKEGKDFIETYFGSYPGIQTYIDGVKEKVRNKGFIETLLGRRRYIYEARSSNHNIRAAGERMAINMPIQGTAADIIKIAMVRIQEEIQKANMRTKMIIQVHDELIFESPIEELSEIERMVKELMPSAMDLDVPLDIDLKTGVTWGSMK